MFLETAVDPIEVETHRRLLDALADAGAGLLMACGGKGLCATCHVYVEQGLENLSDVTPREQATLMMLGGRRPNSRLACQAKIRRGHARVARPSGRYVTTSAELDQLVGRRAQERILHPVDGSVLVERGKIITRSRIRQLAQVEVDIATMRRRSVSYRR
ncbi:MAG: 2Fe-2S iron-sulfur cluster-binding protein [Nannocystaceae bacterium]